MMKKKLSLQTLLNLTEYLEKEISLTQSFVTVSNAVLKTSKVDKDLKEKVRQQFDKRQACQQQLQVFKLARTVANMTDVQGVSNNKRIFELSDLKRDERFYVALLGQKKKSRKTTEDQYVFFIPKSELEDELRKIEERMSELKDQMSEFNESFEVEVDIDKDLDLI